MIISVNIHCCSNFNCNVIWCPHCNNLLTEILKYLKHLKFKRFIIVILTRSTIPVGEAADKGIICATEKL